MAIVRAAHCASCGAPVLWVRAWGFGNPRPIDPIPVGDGEIVLDVEQARYRYVVADEEVAGRRYRVHFPCVDRVLGAAAAAETPIAVGVVAHAHWDREWYRTMEQFRAQLVGVFDGVLDVLERDEAFTAFLCDGQTAMVDDYLAVRPEAEPRVRDLARAGRLALGPWETLADSFLVSGETLVRNLQRGMERAHDLGDVLKVGYLPDQFGQTAQLPQLFRLAGIQHALVHRGVPDEVDTTAFWWEAPDGSRVRTEYLRDGYTNAIRLSDDEKELIARVRDTAAAYGERCRGDLLLFSGGDHEPIRPWLPAVLARANEQQGEYRFDLRRLDDHLARQPVTGLPEHRGELRASGHATVTMGVVSTHVDVRLATARAERALERRAEPYHALFGSGVDERARLDRAWQLLIANSAHDSIAGCSSDDVMREVHVRATSARDIAEGLAWAALTQLAADADAPRGSMLVVNPAARARSGAAAVDAATGEQFHFATAEGTACATQVLDVTRPVELDVELRAAEAMPFLDLLGPDRWAGHRIAKWACDVDAAVPTFCADIARADEPAVDTTGLSRRLREVIARNPAGPVRITLRHPPTTHALVHTSVPAFGWRAHVLVPGAGPETHVAARDGWIANEHVRVNVDVDDGTFTIETADGLRAEKLGAIVDGGDAGDTYNWSPPICDRVIAGPRTVSVETVEHGPVRARLRITRTYAWPLEAVFDEQGSARAPVELPVEVVTTVDVVAGERFVRVAVEFDNRCRDHRVRIVFPLPGAVEASDAECAFAVVRRGLTCDGNAMEAPLATFPAQRFVDCSDGDVGLAVVHDCVTEYECIDGGRALACTLVRSVGEMSRPDGCMRPATASPLVATPDAQVQGPLRRDLGILLHRGNWEAAGLYAVADDTLLPFDVIEAEGDGSRSPDRSGLRVDGAVVTAVRLDAAGRLEVRMVRAASTPGTATVFRNGVAGSGVVVDLSGEVLAAFAGRMQLRPWEVATLRLDETADRV